MITFHLSIFNIKKYKNEKPKKQTNIFLMFENYRHQHKLGENEKKLERIIKKTHYAMLNAIKYVNSPFCLSKTNRY